MRHPARAAAALLLAALGAQSARAGEPNETFAARTVLAGGAMKVSDQLTPGVVYNPDTLMGVRGPSGQIVAVDDDGSPLGSGTASGVNDIATSAGAVRFAVTGLGDDAFSGNHAQFGRYKLYLNVYNSSGSLAGAFHELRTLQPGAIHEFSYSDSSWIGGLYDVYLDNTAPLGGDVDFFSFVGLAPGTPFSARTAVPTSSGVDTVLGWFNAGGNLLSWDDDGGGGRTSMLQGVVPTGGVLTLAVSGFGDDTFTGLHTQAGAYELRLTAVLAADFDEDGDVDGDDLTQWQGDFGPSASSDADNDGDSDGADFLAWQQQLGGGLPATDAAVVVPEPASALLLAAATLLLGAAHSQRRNRP
jgi:hypothetical protein